MKAVWLGAALALAATIGLARNTWSSPKPGWQAFEELAAVLTSPRCLNCHIPGDAPLQGDDGRIHNMNIRRGADGRGTPAQRCRNCHQDANADGAHAPPGAPDWRLPPPAARMAWLGLAAPEICRNLKDPSRNGGRDLAALQEHMTSDPIVAWAWKPGGGRKPPPLSRAEFVARFVEWKKAGAPCETEGKR